MPRQLFLNNAKSTLSVAVSSSTQATLTVQSGHGARFPDPQAPDYFYVTLDDGTNVEVCKCIARSGDALTVLRGLEDTVAQASFATGTRCEVRWTARSVYDLRRRGPLEFIAITPLLNTASWHIFGLPLPTLVGSYRATAFVNSSWRETQPRILSGTANTAQHTLKWYINQALCNVGRGFCVNFRFGARITPNSSHWFMGLVNTTGAVASVHPPSSLTQAIVIGWTNSAAVAPELSIWRNDNAGSAVQLALGSYFRASTEAWYEVEFNAMGNTTSIEYLVRRLDISSIPEARSYFTTDIPTNSAWLSPYMNGATMVASAIQMEHGPWVVTV